MSDVVLWTEQGMSPDQLVTEFPQLGLADVHAALAYYHDNQAAVDQQIQESRKFVDQMKHQMNRSTVSINASKGADGHPIPS